MHLQLHAANPHDTAICNQRFMKRIELRTHEQLTATHCRTQGRTNSRTVVGCKGSHHPSMWCIVMWCIVVGCKVSHHPSMWCICMWCKVKHFWMWRIVMWCTVVGCKVSHHPSMWCIVMWCKVSRHPSALQCDVLLCDVKSHTTLRQM